MNQAITTCEINSGEIRIPAGARVEVLSKEYHDPETGRVRVDYGMGTCLVDETILRYEIEGKDYNMMVPERMLEVVDDEQNDNS